jgi:hypothetical protein
MPGDKLELFLEHLLKSVDNNQFVKLTLSKKRLKSSDLKNVFIKAVELKSGMKLSFVYRYPTKDITRNFGYTEGIGLVREMIVKDFYQTDLFTSNGDFHLSISKSGDFHLLQKPSANTSTPVYSHDKIKKRFIRLTENIYLKELGIATVDWKVKKDMEDKFRQINKYIEIIDGILGSASLPVSLKIADMGSGKGYLTFALYDYLVNGLNLTPEITGIELRRELVENSCKIAELAGFSNLKFRVGTIETARLDNIDMLIALHACDTATDEAIFRGITTGAKVIICAPCCHKQIRKQIAPTNDMEAITKYGILEERQAELLTDGIRALILEAFGYKTKVFEFISTEHTPKNVLIVGIKKGKAEIADEVILMQIRNIKKLFNIEYHHLEKLLHLNEAAQVNLKS